MLHRALLSSLLCLGLSQAVPAQDAPAAAPAAPAAPAAERVRGERGDGVRGDGQRGDGVRGDRGGFVNSQLMALLPALRGADANGDMVVDEKELAVAMPVIRDEWQAQLKQVLTRFDKDGDGKLSETERAEIEEVAKLLRVAQSLRVLDTDNDGQLSEAESKDAEERLTKLLQTHNQAMLERLDTNRDGIISEEERKAAWQGRGGREGGERARVAPEGAERARPVAPVEPK